MEFSHGMKKKLALAAALLPNPELLFLDEPFEGVDAVASRVLRDTLKRCVSRGATVFLTSHVLGDRGEALHRRRHHRARQLVHQGRWTSCAPPARWRTSSWRWSARAGRANRS